MSRVDLHTIGQGSDSLVKTAIELVCKLLFCLFAQKVRPAERSHKKEVAAKEGDWL